MKIEIRDEREEDRVRINEVTALAFRDAAHTCHREHLIMDSLRKVRELSLSLVAVANEGIVGHVAASLVTVSEFGDKWYGIGPISVLPEYQRQGIGCHLMNAAIAELRAKGARGCVLVGDPHFYQRFGFRSDPSLLVPGVPPEVSLSLRFVKCNDHGPATFHPAFMAVLAEPKR